MVPDFLHRDPLPISYSSTGDFADPELRLVVHIWVLYRAYKRVFYRGFSRESFQVFYGYLFCRYSMWHVKGTQGLSYTGGRL